MNDVALSARQRLAAAVVAYDRLRSATEEQRTQAFATLDAELEERGRDYETAQAALKTAQQSGISPGRLAIQRALGRPAGVTVEEAQRAVDAAREGMAEINRQRQLCREEFDHMNANEVTFARIRRDEAAAALLAISPGVAGLVAELRAVRRRRVTLESALREIGKTLPNALPRSWDVVRPEDQQPDPALVATWRAAIEKMLADPSAPIPGGDPPLQPAEAEAA